ncbi:MAG: hypothetical protein ACLQIH_13645 [Myxococcaceae bacterium]
MSSAHPVGLLALVLLGLFPPAVWAARGPTQPDAGPGAAASAPRPSAAPLVEALVAKYGEGQRARAEQGVRQVLAFWRPGPDSDGDEKALADFGTSQFIADAATLERTLARFEEALEAADGHFLEVGRTWRSGAELELGPELPLDAFLAGTEPAAHLQEDLFASKIAFVALLNWPLPTLDEMVAQGPGWTRRQWATARLTRRFSLRPSGAAEAARAAAAARGEAYIAGYNLWVHHLLGPDGMRPFPKGKRLLSHWNLRDQIKADYAEGPSGLVRQRLLVAAMNRIVTQDIPVAVIDDPRLDWDPVANTVRLAPAGEVEERPASQTGGGVRPAVASAEREPDTRYAVMLETFRAARLADRDSPFAPTEIDRRFQFDTEIPEARIKALLEAVVSSPLVPQVAALIEKRLGRKLEPQDLYYAGFLARSKYPEAQLDAMTRKRYPDAAAYKKDIPRLLRALGFSPQKAAWLDAHIVVDPARGSGHALEAARRGDFPHLRTRISPGGMDYKGYNIAVHEMGHNVEQVFSLYSVDSTLLQGVPGNAFTEALAFTFQNRDLELLGLGAPDAQAERLRVLNDFWTTYEISGAALVDLGVWRWLYAHPEATPSELREATLAIARELWNRYYAPVLGGKDSGLLAIYSHMVDAFLYLPYYPLGHLIAFQLEEKLKGTHSGAEFERVASFGRVTPDYWMVHATGAPVSAEPLFRATATALAAETSTH